MGTHAGLRLLIGIAVGSLLFPAGIAVAQTKSAPQKEYERLIYSVKGPDLYRAHCAPCHGVDGKGDGAVAPALKTKVADLTVLAKNSGGKFPVERARKIILGEEPSLIPHGSREMPIWGPIFHQIENDRDFGNVRIQNLIKYLETIQQK